MKSKQITPGVWVPVGHSTADPATRNIHQSFIALGWLTYWRARIQPVCDWITDQIGRAPRVLFHNTWGALAKEEFGPHETAMEFLQYLKAMRIPELQTLCKSFVADFLAIQSAYDGEIIHYIGSPHRSAELKANLVNGQVDVAKKKIWMAVRPLLEAGTSVAYDDMGQEPLDSLSGQFYWQTKPQLEAIGAKSYVEATPELVNGEPTKWFGENSIITRDLFLKRHGASQRKDIAHLFPKYTDPRFYTGEVIQLMAAANYATNANTLAGFNNVIDENSTPCASLSLWKRLQESNSEIKSIFN